MDALTLTGYLVLGFTGSLHCAGMCGPIIWMMPFQQLGGGTRVLAIALYHAGRITAYCLLGTAIFSLRNAFQPQWQQGVALACGCILLLAGIASMFGLGSGRLLRPFQALVLAALGKVAGRRGPLWLGLTGFFNGLLPCGMVYIALAAVTRSGHSGQALASMALFGLGTVPMLLAVTLLRRRLRFVPTRWAHVLMLVFGTVLMLRGANLGIPYLSPEREPVSEAAAPVIKCCHRP